jgi:hypothetical protein
MQILVLGAGFGGLEPSTRLSDAFGDELEIVLIDQAEGFVFGFSKRSSTFVGLPCPKNAAGINSRVMGSRHRRRLCDSW